MHKLSFTTAALLLSATATQAAAFPRLDVAKSCHAAVENARRDNAATKMPGQSSAATPAVAPPSFKDCMKGENDARKAALALWPAVKPRDRTTCANLSGMVYPSYVELRTCLDMAKQAANAPAASRAEKIR